MCVLECNCGMVISTPGTQTCCPRCHRILGIHHVLVIPTAARQYQPIAAPVNGTGCYGTPLVTRTP